MQSRVVFDLRKAREAGKRMRLCIRCYYYQSLGSLITVSIKMAQP